MIVTDLVASPRPREAGTGDDGRHAGHVRRSASTLAAHLLPLVDRAQLLRARLDLRRDLGGFPLAQRPRHLVGRQDLRSAPGS